MAVGRIGCLLTEAPGRPTGLPWGIHAPASTAAVAVGAVALVLIAFGGGAGLIALRKPWTKGMGMGMGLMIGWNLLSITTVGFCTGLNPEMYTGGM